MAGPSKAESTSLSSFDAFKKVDELVAKPVLGSDGAHSWQTFRKDLPANVRKEGSVAPKAPLKKADRLGTGFTSWEEERKHEEKVRQDAGHVSAGAGYTTFKKKNNAEEAAERKRKAQIEARIRPDDVDYFKPAKTFEGWKFDYIFTTGNNGTGYYWDGMDSIKKENGELKDDTKTKGNDEQHNTSTEQTVSRKDHDSTLKPKKKKRKKNTAPVIVHDPNNPREQIYAMLQKRNQALSGNLDLPAGWEVATDPVSQKQYYFHRATGERNWEKPQHPKPANEESSLDSKGIPDGWKSAVDSSSGKTYFYHTTSGETRWEKPT